MTVKNFAILLCGLCFSAGCNEKTALDAKDNETAPLKTRLASRSMTTSDSPREPTSSLSKNRATQPPIVAKKAPADGLNAMNMVFLAETDGNPGVAERQAKAVTRFVIEHGDYIARQMLRAGQLKRKEDFWGSNGQVKDIPGAVAFQRMLMLKQVGSREEFIRVMSQPPYLGNREAAAGLLNYDPDLYEQVRRAERSQQ